jgi:hypothetical protein
VQGLFSRGPGWDDRCACDADTAAAANVVERARRGDAGWASTASGLEARIILAGVFV